MAGEHAKTRWGGLADGRFRPSGYFRTADDDGVAWLVDPDGGRFLSKGVDNVKFDPDQVQGTGRAPYADSCRAKYGSETAWRSAVATRLAGWGFNTVGAWSDAALVSAGTKPLAAAPNLDLGMSFAWGINDRNPGAPRLHFPDVFDPAFAAHAAARASELCAPDADNGGILGWFIDNELRWGPDWRGPDELLALFLALPPDTPGRFAASSFLRARGHADAASASDVDCDAFAARVAERYFAVTVTAIKGADPNHLVLGCRFALPPRTSVLRAAAHAVDVISFNCYETSPETALAFYGAGGKPCLIGEFSFRGADSGLPNTRGAGPVVPTQQARADGYRQYTRAAFGHPQVIGCHWFEHADQPAEGRFDGENSNFGTVSIDDRPYAPIVATMREVNAATDALHDETGRQPVATGAQA